MGTGISKSRLALVVLTLTVAGCGGASTKPFGWVHPQAAPSGWRVTTIATGSAMAYPANWERQHGDAGTATAAQVATGGRFLGYLNLTPRQGSESLSNWPSFRTAHNVEEGDRDVKRLASATGLRFLSGHGSCVKDSYTTSVGTSYIEIACLVVGTRASAVIVGAAPPDRWSREAATLERAIEGVRT